MERPDSSLGGRWADQIETKDIEWMWPNRIPAGMFTVIDGNPGVGKSTLLAELAAHVTTGKQWPDGAPCDNVGPVMIFSAEDDPERTIRPRLDAAGCARDHVMIYGLSTVEDEWLSGGSPPLALPADKRTLIREALAIRPKLVIFDPFEAFLEDKITNKQVREVVTLLTAIARNYGTAIIVLRHLAKGARNPLTAGLGYTAIAAQSRALYLIARKRGDDNVSVLASTRFSIGAPPSSLAYRLVESPDTKISHVEWDGEIEITAEQLLKPPRPAPMLEAAKVFLRDILAGGARPASEVRGEAEKEGIAPKTLRSAREELSIYPFKRGFSGPWLWRLPEHDSDDEDDGQDRAPADAVTDGQRESEIDRLAAADAPPSDDEVRLYLEGLEEQADDDSVPCEEDYEAAKALFRDVAHEHDGQDRAAAPDHGQDRDLRHCNSCGSDFPARLLGNDHLCPMCGEEPL